METVNFNDNQLYNFISWLELLENNCKIEKLESETVKKVIFLPAAMEREVEVTDLKFKLLASNDIFIVRYYKRPILDITFVNHKQQVRETNKTTNVISLFKLNRDDDLYEPINIWEALNLLNNKDEDE